MVAGEVPTPNLSSYNISAVLVRAGEAVEQFLSSSRDLSSKDSNPPFNLPYDILDFLSTRSHSESAVLILATVAFVFVMASWLGNLGRFSPFTRTAQKGSTEVSDADFSYITADDLRRHEAEASDKGSRETDVLIIKNKKKEYLIHFPAYSIAKGELTVGQVREQAAKKVGTGDDRRVKLLYRGKNLQDDQRTCKQEGLQDGAEIVGTVAEGLSLGGQSESEDDDEFADVADDQPTPDGEPRRRRNRGKKTKRRNKREERENEAGAFATPSQPPRPSNAPLTAIDKLNALRENLRSFDPEVSEFLQSPPTDPDKRDFEHKRLSETIMTQVLLKLDAVETDGDNDARARRKELVKETTQILNSIDAVVKS